MSYAVDVNLLLYASDRSGPHAEQAGAFLAQCAARPETCCFAWITLLGYLRMATHPAIFERPLTQAEAEANVAALLALPQVRALAELDGFWAVYRKTSGGLPVRGNLVPDAHLAAILLQHGVTTLHTADTDFRRFPQLDVRNPLK